ncbi:MAG: TerB family tellurite resistance protein [Bacilli bacterium]
MKRFFEICKNVEKMDVLTYSAVLAEKSLKILPELNAITEDAITATTIFATFIIGSIVADGKIKEEEYILLYPMLYTFFGDSVDYEECKKIARKFKKEGKELKQYIDYIVDILGMFSDELKEDIITVCLLICAIDGNISAKEKNWVKQLID